MVVVPWLFTSQRDELLITLSCLDEPRVNQAPAVGNVEPTHHRSSCYPGGSISSPCPLHFVAMNRLKLRNLEEGEAIKSWIPSQKICQDQSGRLMG